MNIVEFLTLIGLAIAIVGVPWYLRGELAKLENRLARGENKIENIEKGTNALLLIHRDELFALYKDQIKIVFNPSYTGRTASPFSQEDKELLLEKLKSGYLTHEEAKKLTEILRYEENEARRKGQQTAVLVIGALLLLIALMSKK